MVTEEQLDLNCYIWPTTEWVPAPEDKSKLDSSELMYMLRYFTWHVRANQTPIAPLAIRRVEDEYDVKCRLVTVDGKQYVAAKFNSPEEKTLWLLKNS